MRIHSVLLLAIFALPGARADSLDALARDYRLRIETARQPLAVGLPHGQLVARAASPARLARYQPLLLREWRRYPPELIRRVRLARILLCAGLSFAGQKRQAVPAFSQRTLYLDVDHASLAYLRHVLHHEFYHIIDLRDDGQLYGDPAWSRLNPAGFRYGSGGKNMRTPGVGRLTRPRPGFLNLYQTAGVEEDKAELFAYLLQRDPRALEWARKDPVVASKVALLKQQLARFCRGLDERFWTALQRSGDR